MNNIVANLRENEMLDTKAWKCSTSSVTILRVVDSHYWFDPANYRLHYACLAQNISYFSRTNYCDAEIDYPVYLLLQMLYIVHFWDVPRHRHVNSYWNKCRLRIALQFATLAFSWLYLSRIIQALQLQKYHTSIAFSSFPYVSRNITIMFCH